MNLPKFTDCVFAAATVAAVMACQSSEAFTGPKRPMPKVPEATAELGTLPPARYVTDYYAPPTDWWPKKEIKDYTVHTRVPDLFWLKYDGANTLALRLKPITKDMVARQMGADLIFNSNATNFVAKLENDEDNRTIGVFNLDVPADDFIEFSFKAKNTAIANAGKDMWIYSDGLFKKTKLSECVDKATSCKDGFTAYKVKLSPKAGAKLKNIAFILDKANADGFKQEWIIMDLLFRRSAPKARFTDIPQRQWIRQADFDKDPAAITAANGIKDVYSFIESKPEGFETMPLSLVWDKNYTQDGSYDDPATYKPTFVEEKIDGKTYKGIRFTLQTGKACYVRFPVKFDASVYNTLSFLTKIELPKDLKFRNTNNKLKLEEGELAKKAILGDDYQRFYGSDNVKMNLHFDSFGFGYGNRAMDIEEWCKYGHPQGTVAQSWQRGAAAPAGYKAVVFDAVNDVFIGNKNSYIKDTTYWCFYYDTRKIAPGQTVTVTILDPKVTKGLMYAGGDLVKHAEFLKWRDSYKPTTTSLRDSKKYLGAPAKGMLKDEIEIVDDHKPEAEFIVTHGTSEPRYQRIVDRALETLNRLFTEKYKMTSPIPVLSQPSKEDNTKIYIGGDHYRRINRKQYDEDMKRLYGTDGFAVRAVRADDYDAIYIYAADFNFAGNSRGLANGIYTWIMNNTDIICTGAKGAEFVFDIEPSGDMEAVWGDDIQISPLAIRGPGLVYGSYDCNDFNRCTRVSVWCDASIGGHRPRSTNHWWGYGTSRNIDGTKPPKGQLSDTCGLDENGNRMVPGCYTGHPCLVSVLDNAKDEYISMAFKPEKGCGSQYQFEPHGWAKYPVNSKGFGWNRYDIFGLWVEDSQTICQCEKCFTPIRLPNGDLIERPRGCHSMGECEFLSTQFYANGSAMINQVNVYARRDMKVESIAYFWMQEPPAFNISRNYYVRFCPYIRKDYMEPIFSPANDVWYRNIYRWGQMDCGLSMYEYTLLYQCAHPVADVFQRELQAEIDQGRLLEMFFEPGPAVLPDLIERWTIMQLLWDPYQDVAELRRKFIRRAFREAAPEMEKFFTTINYANYQAGPSNRIEFEMEGGSAIILNSMPATDGKGGTLIDECTRYLEAAMKAVKNEKAKVHVEAWYKAWPKYVKCARR